MTDAASNLPPLEYEAPRDREVRSQAVPYVLPFTVYSSDRTVRLVVCCAYVLILGLGWLAGRLDRALPVIAVISLLGLIWTMRSRRPVVEIHGEGLRVKEGPLVPWVNVLRARAIGNGITFSLDDGTRTRLSFWDLLPRDVNVLCQILKDKGILVNHAQALRQLMGDRL